MSEQHVEGNMMKSLLILTQSLRSMEQKCNQYLKNYESTSEFKMFRTAFRQFQFQKQLSDVVEFTACNITSEKMSQYDRQNQKIKVCYNSVSGPEQFNKILTYNMVQLYDDLRANVNPYDCEAEACTQVRALKLSKICQTKDCFQAQIIQNLSLNSACKNKELNSFENCFSQCVRDIAPFNDMASADKTIFG